MSRPLPWAGLETARETLARWPRRYQGTVRTLHVGENATFQVRAGPRRYALRLYRPGRWPAAWVETEHRYMAHLGKRLGVLTAIRARDRETVQEIAPARMAALFPWVDGRHVGTVRPSHLRQVGAHLGRMHARSASFPPKGRPRLDWGGLVTRPRRTALKAWSELIPDHPAPDLDTGAAMARQLWKRLGLRQAMCHADLHWGNLKVHARRIHPFDFDDCGVAPLAYDLAVVLYASDHGSLERPTLLDHLLTGYHQTAPESIPPEAVLLLRWARARWLMGWVLERPELFEADYLRTRSLALVAECAELERELSEF